jgi:hypothetical protein
MISSEHLFLYRFRKAIMNVIARCGPWGTHTLRKTGYILALWGEGELAKIMMSARHNSLNSAKRYFTDALSLLEIAKRQE